MIPQSEIQRMAARRLKQDTVIEKDYVITWVLLGLAQSTTKQPLAFKGGTALKKCYLPDYRYSEDLDFTLIGKADDADLINGFKGILHRLAKSQGFQFEIQEGKVERRSDSLTFYIEYVGPLQALLGGRHIKVDITLVEQLEFKVKQKAILSPYSDSSENTETLQVYSLEEVLTEKLCALIDRTEPRDLYDIDYLFQLGSVDHEAVAMAFPGKASYKGVDTRRLARILVEKKRTFASMWENQLAHQVDDLPDLDATIRQVNRNFRKYDLVNR